MNGLGKPAAERMTFCDIEAAARLEAECFHAPWSRESLSESLAQTQEKNPDCYYIFFVVRQAALGKAEYSAAHIPEPDADGVPQTLLGYAGAQIVFDEMNITNVAVAKSARRQGVGVRLLEALETYARQNGISGVTLEVRVGNAAAVALYEKAGFACEGRRKNFYSNPTEDCYIMWKHYPC